MGGIVATVADVAAGVSILTRLDLPRPVTTLSFSSQQIGPARGERIACRGRVDRVGRHVAMTGAEVYSITGDRRELCARLSATFSISPA
jgi:acyl-coenzyme A thioesterase PaaI-like protein